MAEQLENWLHDFQSHIYVLTDGNVQFTMDTWKPCEELLTIETKKILAIGGPSIPYLDTELCYNENKALFFCLDSTPGSNTKCLHYRNNYSEDCMRAVPIGVRI